LHNRKLYLAYGMVLCLVTLTDLQTRRAGLSASAELLVLNAALVNDSSGQQWSRCLVNTAAVKAQTSQESLQCIGHSGRYQ